MTDPLPSDETLLAAARAGDRQALEALLERHELEVYRFGLRMCRDPEDARDVLQDTLLAMARGVRDFRGASSLSTWLFTIARSFCVKKRRRSKHAPREERSLDTVMMTDAKQMVDPADGPDDALEGRRVKEALEQAIAGLEPPYREVLLLRDVEGLTAPEVAEALGLTTQAVKSRLHRARLSVRERIAPLLGIDTDRPAGPGGCPDVLTMFSQHLEDDISPDLCAQMERHLESCGRCRGACDTLREMLAMCRTAGASVAVPASVQASIRAAVRGFLSENGQTKTKYR